MRKRISQRKWVKRMVDNNHWTVKPHALSPNRWAMKAINIGKSAINAVKHNRDTHKYINKLRNIGFNKSRYSNSQDSNTQFHHNLNLSHFAINMGLIKQATPHNAFNKLQSNNLTKNAMNYHHIYNGYYQQQGGDLNNHPKFPVLRLGKYHGLKYNYNPDTKSLNFTRGSLTWNGGQKKLGQVEPAGFIDSSHNQVPANVKPHEIKQIHFGNNIHTPALTNTRNMFANNRNLQSVNLGNNFDTSNVKDARGMFKNNRDLKQLTLGKKFNTPKLVSKGNMFSRDAKLHVINNANHNIAQQAHKDNVIYVPAKDIKELAPRLTQAKQKQILALEKPAQKQALTHKKHLLLGQKHNPTKSLEKQINKFGQQVHKHADEKVSKIVSKMNQQAKQQEKYQEQINKQMENLKKQNQELKEVNVTMRNKNINSLVKNNNSVTRDDKVLNQYTNSLKKVNSMKNLNNTITYAPLRKKLGLDKYERVNQYANGLKNVNSKENLNDTVTSKPLRKRLGLNKYRGLDYNFDRKTGTLNFTKGKISSNAQAFIGSYHNYNGEIVTETPKGIKLNDIKHINFSKNVDFSNARLMNGMFANNPSLKSVNLGSNFDSRNVLSMSEMFTNDPSLKKLNLGQHFSTHKMNSILNDQHLMNILDAHGYVKYINGINPNGTEDMVLGDKNLRSVTGADRAMKEAVKHAGIPAQFKPASHEQRLASIGLKLPSDNKVIHTHKQKQNLSNSLHARATKLNQPQHSSNIKRYIHRDGPQM